MSRCSNPSPAKSDCGATRWCAHCSKNRRRIPARNLGTPRDASRDRTSLRSRASGRVSRTRMGACVARRLEIDALWTAAVGVPDGRRCARRSAGRRGAARSGTRVRHRHASHDCAVPANTGCHCRCPAASVIDYGCGSGILGIAALKLGAAHVTAVDLDPQALIATRENAIRNGVSSQHRNAGPCRRHCGRPYCVVANILAGPLIELAPTLDGACETQGRSALVGTLEDASVRGKGRLQLRF